MGGRGRRISEFKASLIYKVNSKTARAIQRNPVSKKQTPLDLEGYKVYISGQIVDLTQREFELLKVLLQNQGRVLSRQTLLNRVWSYDFYGDERIVDTHIKNLRKKLELNYIETIRGVGYRIDYEAEK